MRSIGIIGAGNVGGNLGRRWTLTGHDVMFGVRDPSKPQVQVLVEATGAEAGSVAEAVAFGDVVVIATPWPAVPNVAAASDTWEGKIVIDATNRFGPVPSGEAPSGGEQLARLLPGARVVKAFNSLGAELLLNPSFGGDTLTLFICGDDPDAKAAVSELAQEISYDVIDAGPLENAGLLESLAKLWIALSRQDHGRDIAFKLLRR